MFYMLALPDNHLPEQANECILKIFEVHKGTQRERCLDLRLGYVSTGAIAAICIEPANPCPPVNAIEIIQMYKRVDIVTHKRTGVVSEVRVDFYHYELMAALHSRQKRLLFNTDGSGGVFQFYMNFVRVLEKMSVLDSTRVPAMLMAVVRSTTFIIEPCF
jgi:hypothetical protein